MKCWLNNDGETVRKLFQLYRLLVWESSALLALASADKNLPENTQFGRDQLEKLIRRGRSMPKEDQKKSEKSSSKSEPANSEPMAMEVSEPSSSSASKEKSEEEQNQSDVVRQLKPIISTASRYECCKFIVIVNPLFN